MGRWLDIKVLRLFSGSCGISVSLYLILGLYLYNHYQIRGYFNNYSRRAHPSLHRSIIRYKKSKLSESLYQLFPKYLIDGSAYFMVWYVPKTGTAMTGSLKPGSEPLIFDSNGQWLDDERLFARIALMWSILLGITKRHLRQKYHKDAKILSAFVTQDLTTLAERLRENHDTLKSLGLEEEYHIVLRGIPVVAALYRNALDVNLKLGQWGDAYGWDSITEIDYQDALILVEGTKELEHAKDAFKRQHDHSRITQAATRLAKTINQTDQGLGWKGKKDLLWGLGGMTEDFSNDELRFRFQDCRWIAPDNLLSAYRSRLRFARQVDQRGKG
jgi:hypothetical protein